MEISSVNQAKVFLWMIVCGGVCTLVFDIFRGIRRYRSPQNSIILIQDLVLWSIEICIVYMVAFKLNYAKVRAYEIVALAIGSLLYFVLLSDFVVKIVCHSTEKIVKAVMWVVSPVSKLIVSATEPFKKTLLNVVNKMKAKCNLKRLLPVCGKRFKKTLISGLKRCQISVQSIKNACKLTKVKKN